MIALQILCERHSLAVAARADVCGELGHGDRHPGGSHPRVRGRGAPAGVRRHRYRGAAPAQGAGIQAPGSDR